MIIKVDEEGKKMMKDVISNLMRLGVPESLDWIKTIQDSVELIDEDNNG